MNARHKRALGAVSAVTALALAGGVAAQFTTSTTSAPQQIGTGTLALSIDSVNPTVWTQDISNLAPGDSVERFFDLRNSGSLKFSGITASQTNTLADLLTAPSDVSVKLLGCSVAWNTTSGVCSSGAVDVLTGTSVRSWASSAKALSTFEDFGAGEVRHLKIVTSIDKGASNTVQGKSGTITYTFAGAQRSAGVSGSTSDATTILGAPATLTTTPSATTASTAVFSFTDPTAGKATYTVAWGETGNSSVAPQRQTLAPGATSYSLTGLEAGKNYDVSLTAQLGVQKSTSTTSYSVPVPAPTGLVTSAVTKDSVALSWTDNSGGKVTYLITYTSASGVTKTASVAAGQSSTTLSGLSSDTAYTISVAAQSGSASSSAATASIKTSAAGWVQVASMNTVRTAFGVDAAAADPNVYAFSTHDTAIGGEQYSASTNSWSPIVAMPNVGRTSIVGAARGTDGNIYTVGGTDASNNSVSTVQRYSPSAKQWSTVKPMNTARSAYNGMSNYVLSAPNGSLYAGSSDGSIERYDISSNTWTTLTKFAGMSGAALFGSAPVSSTNGSLYFFGGVGIPDGGGAQQALKSSLRYNTSTGTWSRIADAPRAMQNAVATQGADGLIYVVGGSGAVTDVLVYNPSTDKWSTSPFSAASINRTGFGLAKDSDGRIYVIGGYRGGAGLLKDVQRLG